MFGSIGMPEMVIILVIALIIFGPRKLPELGRSLGKSLGRVQEGLERAPQHPRGRNPGRRSRRNSARRCRPSRRRPSHASRPAGSRAESIGNPVTGTAQPDRQPHQHRHIRIAPTHGARAVSAEVDNVGSGR